MKWALSWTANNAGAELDILHLSRAWHAHPCSLIYCGSVLTQALAWVQGCGRCQLIRQHCMQMRIWDLLPPRQGRVLAPHNSLLLEVLPPPVTRQGASHTAAWPPSL